MDTRRCGQASVRIGDAEAPDFSDGSFDAVLASLVIFFLPDPLAAMLERIPTGQLDAAREVIIGELGRMRDAKGDITIPMRGRITTANRP